MTACLQSHSIGQTMVLTLSNPQHRNALGPEICSAGIEALNVAESSPDVRAVVITGDGGHFCSGGHLQRLLSVREASAAMQSQGIETLHNWIETIRAFPKPVIASVEGTCAGAGFSLALACDLVVAAEDAVFLMAHSKVGLSPDGGATWHLLRELPRATAMHLLLCGERIGARRLHELGLVTQTCATGTALDAAQTIAQTLAGLAPEALASIKELAGEATQVSLHSQLAAEQQHFLRNLNHPHAGEAISAFLEKRPARLR